MSSKCFLAVFSLNYQRQNAEYISRASDLSRARKKYEAHFECADYLRDTQKKRKRERAVMDVCYAVCN